MNIIAARLLHPDFGANYFDSLQPDVLVALTPKNHNIRVIHIEKDRFDFNKECDLLLLIFITSYAPTAYKIADEFRKRGTTVVLGGAHASALPDEAKQHADSVVIGEAEETWPQLLKDFEKGKLKPFYRQTRPVDLSTIQVYNRKYTPGSSGKIVVEATRGCPVGCSFCAITNTLFGRTYRERPIEHVIKEIKTIPQKFLFFCDASLTADPEY
ncbi:MAG: cobalamin-dependent protein, partial [Thermoplasmata archaeon]|nr:cobalamin-dependent protein [Thermoplasmata archaeon]